MHSHYILEACGPFLKTLGDAMHVRHHAQIVILQYPSGIVVLHECLNQILPLPCTSHVLIKGQTQSNF
jgi:hypothetical protein